MLANWISNCVKYGAGGRGQTAPVAWSVRNGGEGPGSSFPENTEETPGFQSFQPQTPSSSCLEGRKILFLFASRPEKALEVCGWGAWGGCYEPGLGARELGGCPSLPGTRTPCPSLSQ